MGNFCGVGEDILFNEFIGKLVGCGVSLVGGVALLFIIYGGFILMTSSGDPSRIRVGKEYVTYAIIGLVLAIGSFVLIQVLGGDILQIPGLGQ